MRTRGAHLHCLRMAGCVKAKSQILLTASLAVLTVECRTDARILTGSSSMVLRLSRLLLASCETLIDDYAAKVFYTEAVEASRQGGYTVGYNMRTT